MSGTELPADVRIPIRHSGADESLLDVDMLEHDRVQLHDDLHDPGGDGGRRERDAGTLWYGTEMV